MQAAGLRARLEQRARTIDTIRRFFAERAVVEVTTPALSNAAATDPALHSVSCRVEALGDRLFLHTSPEHAMKRLLAAGSGDIWQLARVFRDGELGRWHRPEFDLLEWYRCGFDEFALMDEVFALFAELSRSAGMTLGRLDLRYAEAFRSALGLDPHRPDGECRQGLERSLRDRGIDVPAGLGLDALLDLALSTVIVPAWPRDTAVFLFDYPATQAALARLKPTQPAVAARFEVFINGIELGNGYFELNDADEQRRRFTADIAARQRAGLPAVPVDESLLAALEQGLPDCAGVAIGLDRLLALLARADALTAVGDGPQARLAPDT